MATKKRKSGSTTSARSTVSGPSRGGPRRSGDALEEKMAATDALAEAMPSNPNKPAEYGRASLQPQPGATTPLEDPRATGSTLTESFASPKVGSGKPKLGLEP